MTFDEFAAARLPAVLRFATALTGDPDLAKDLVQEVLIRVSERWPEIGSPEAYVRKMVVNEYLSWRRRSWRLIPWGTASYGPGGASPDPADGPAPRGAAGSSRRRDQTDRARAASIKGHSREAGADDLR